MLLSRHDFERIRTWRQLRPENRVRVACVQPGLPVHAARYRSLAAALTRRFCYFLRACSALATASSFGNDPALL